MKFTDGVYYAGEWLNDLFNGHGVFMHPEQKYEGSWIKGERNGHGVM